MRLRVIGLVLSLSTLMVCLSPAGEEGKKLVSGPLPGKPVPGAFDARVVNGEFKGKQHCVICENRLFPMVLAFIRHPDATREIADDSPVAYLLDKMEAATDSHEGYYLKAAAFFLSPHANSSATIEGEKNAKELVEEARNREYLLRRLEKRGEKYTREKTVEAKIGEKETMLKYATVTLAAYPAEGPKGYAISPDAEVTLVFFSDLKILVNEAIPAGKFSKEDVDRFFTKVDKTIRSWKPAATDSKKASPKVIEPEK